MFESGGGTGGADSEGTMKGLARRLGYLLLGLALLGAGIPLAIAYFRSDVPHTKLDVWVFGIPLFGLGAVLAAFSKDGPVQPDAPRSAPDDTRSVRS